MLYHIFIENTFLQLIYYFSRESIIFFIKICFQRNQKQFENRKKFDPERFQTDNWCDVFLFIDNKTQTNTGLCTKIYQM